MPQEQIGFDGAVARRSSDGARVRGARHPRTPRSMALVGQSLADQDFDLPSAGAELERLLRKALAPAVRRGSRSPAG